MDKLYPVIIAFVISILMSGWIHPIIVRIAKLKNIVDNPDARKLQREPVPVLGGMAVFSCGESCFAANIFLLFFWKSDIIKGRLWLITL